MAEEDDKGVAEGENKPLDGDGDNNEGENEKAEVDVVAGDGEPNEGAGCEAALVFIWAEEPGMLKVVLLPQVTILNNQQVPL